MTDTKKKNRFFYKTHLYLGIVSGLIVFIVAVTGCCWVFQEEVTALTADRSVKAENKPFITPTEAKEIASKILPNRAIHGTAYGHATDPVEVIFYESDPAFYQSVFLNPYSGEVIEIKDHQSGFFWFVLQGHLYLWLPKKIGSQIMSYGTMVFVIMLVTGIVLWWPKKKNGRKQRFTFDWKRTTRWRRKNFDLHSVVGFYVSLFALIIAFSGLIMAFNWIYFVTYKAWGGDHAPQFIIPESQKTLTTMNPEETPPIDLLLARLMQDVPEYESLEFHYPTSDSAAIYVEVSHGKGIYYNSDYRFFDQYTLKELKTPSIYGTYAEASLADKVIRMNYDIHVGAIGGLVGKILAFLISLITATLPVTGLLLWLGRKSKSSSVASSDSELHADRPEMNSKPKHLRPKIAVLRNSKVN